MTFQGSALSFTSLFGDGIKPVEHQNHIFPESGIVTCSIIESSRGSLICVPLTDGFSSDCDSYLTVSDPAVQKENGFEPMTASISKSGLKSSGESVQGHHVEEKRRLFVCSRHDTVDDRSEILLRGNGDNSNTVDCLTVHQEETDSRLFVHMQHESVENGSEVLLQTNGDCSNSANCMEEQQDNDDEAHGRLFVHTHHDLVEDGTVVLLQTKCDGCSTTIDSSSTHEGNSHFQGETTVAVEPDSAKVGKKKGGWPKGKKRRKGLNVIAVPKAPATGYVLFLNKRRKLIQKSNPEIPFADVTKQIGNEWTNLPLQEKQAYLKRAEEDKKRYRNELREYQQSEAYKTYTAKKKKLAEGRQDECGPATELIHDIEDEDSRQLYCSVCDQLFTSIHNKREHLYGKQHLSNITGAIQKATSLNDKGKTSKEKPVMDGEDSSISSERLRLRDSVVSVSDAMDLLITLSKEQGNEIEFLKQTNVNLRQHKCALERDLKLLEELYQKREAELESIKLEGKTLSSQLVDLRMVPKLFGIINF